MENVKENEVTNPIIAQLEVMLEDEEEESLRKYVLGDLLDGSYETDDEIVSFLEDLMRHGCVSGMVSALIYYTDTNKFFDAYYDEINELRVEFEEGTGEPLKIGYHMKNDLAWFAYEETARTIMGELGL